MRINSLKIEKFSGGGVNSTWKILPVLQKF